ncbi:MAG: hypothetical protein CMO44_19625 [Verrucomicrobiales bacterium]|nr:hypothetical protein [Verrucomicrobiales bacterium]
MTFPLPLSNNWRVFGLPIVSGAFTGNVVIFPGEFKKKTDTFQPRHVFILQDKQKRFNFVYWKYNIKEPSMLPIQAWDLCFDKNKINTYSNRYYLTLRGRNIIIPYIPDTLHKRWTKSTILNQPDLTYSNALFKHLIQPLFQQHANRNLKRSPFTGWKKTLNLQEHYLHTYKEILIQQKKNTKPIAIDISQPFDKLDNKKKEAIKDAFNIINTIFPKFITKIN